MDGDIERYGDAASVAAKECNVAADLHPKDFILRFLLTNRSFPDEASAVRYYFRDGKNSAQKLAGYVNEFCGVDETPIKLLEFASGYGCVTRHLKNVLPAASVTSCDIHDEAVTFIRNRLRVPSVGSTSIPEELKVPHTYDVVFALSFFSHMPDRTWGRWLNSLGSRLRSGGFLVFTTHGLKSARYFGDPALDPNGFWFAASSEQGDLDAEEYGQTIVNYDYVLRKVLAGGLLDLVLYKEADWWGHQDLFILRKR